MIKYTLLDTLLFCLLNNYICFIFTVVKCDVQDTSEEVEYGELRHQSCSIGLSMWGLAEDTAKCGAQEKFSKPLGSCNSKDNYTLNYFI